MRYRLPPFAAALVVAAACADEPTAVDVAAAAKLATVEWESGKPALYVRRLDGSGRARVRFARVEDLLPDQSPYVPPVSDAAVRALGPVRWSPDGAWLAVVVTLLADQSQVVLVDSAGRRAFVASANGQAIMTDVDWSPDGRRVVYGMSTRPRAASVDLFVSDVGEAHALVVADTAPPGSGRTALAFGYVRTNGDGSVRPVAGSGSVSAADLWVPPR